MSDLSTPVTVGMFTLTAAICAQVYAAHHAMKIKRAELEYNKMSEAYRNVIESAGVFGMNPSIAENHEAFVKAFFSSRIFASPRTDAAMAAKDGIMAISVLLRDASAVNDSVLVKEVRAAFQAKIVETAAIMRQDLLEINSHSVLQRALIKWRRGRTRNVTRLAVETSDKESMAGETSKPIKADEVVVAKIKNDENPVSVGQVR